MAGLRLLARVPLDNVAVGGRIVGGTNPSPEWLGPSPYSPFLPDYFCAAICSGVRNWMRAILLVRQ